VTVTRLYIGLARVLTRAPQSAIVLLSSHPSFNDSVPSVSLHQLSSTISLPHNSTRRHCVTVNQTS